MPRRLVASLYQNATNRRQELEKKSTDFSTTDFTTYVCRDILMSFFFVAATLLAGKLCSQFVGR